MEEIDLKELFDYFRGKVVWILCAVIFVVILGNSYVILKRVPLFRSSTTIVLVSDQGMSNTNELQLNKNLVSTYSEIVKSRKILEPVIKNLDLKYSYVQLKGKVGVSSVTNTEIIRISVSDKDPETATKIANEIANVFSSEIPKIYKINNVSVVDKAVSDSSAKPYNVNYLKDNVIFIAIAIILSCGVIFVCFYFDTSIKTSEDIENKLGLTVIGIVPMVAKE